MKKDSLPLLIWIRTVKNRIISRNKEAAMYLIFMRHGEAVPQTEDVPNRERRLTKEGKKQVRITSRMLARFLKDRPLRIFASPFMRTRQTARILSEECFAEGLHLTEELLQGDFRRIENHLITDGGPLALVGHHPFLQSYLLEAAGAGIQPDLASISVVDYDMAWKQGKLIAYFTPALKKIEKGRLMKKLLTIAGSDSSGGAGIQADLKTFAALGAYGMSCICTLTAQNTTGVSMVVNTPVEMVTAQLEAVYSDIPPDGVKTGMLSTPTIVSAVAEFLHSHKGPAVVIDPVMVATTGAILLEKEAIETYKDILIPEADLITPNIPESEVLSGLEIKTEKDMENAAERMMEYGCRAVLVKGGHRVHDAVDILFDGKQFYRYEGKRIKTKNTHGTGCTLSAALAARLAEGKTLPEAVAEAKAYLTGAIEAAKDETIGQGSGPVRHFWFCGTQGR